MTVLGLEFCDASLRAAVSDGAEGIRPLPARGGSGALLDWPAFAARHGKDFIFGREAEGIWHVHPRMICHNFLDHLSREASPLALEGSPLSYSQLSYFFLRDYAEQTLSAASDRLVLAVPGAYLKDPVTEDEKVGLLLGMAQELKWPLAGVVDMACAALCDPRLAGVHPAWPIVVLDVHLHGTEVTLFRTDQRLRRADFLQLPQTGLVQFLKHVTTAMGNRFLRHTAFDILADGRLEQAFYRQVKDFLFGDAPEFHFQINTAKRAYEMVAPRQQLLADALPFATAAAAGVTTLLHKHTIDVHATTLVLTARAAAIPGLEARLRHAGIHHVLRLARDAAAHGAARLAAELPVPADVADVPVLTAVTPEQASLQRGARWEVRLQRAALSEPRHAPTHVIIDGVGHPLLGNGVVRIGAAGNPQADVTLPAHFHATPDCLVQLTREAGRFWLDGAAAGDESPAGRLPVEAGDRLELRLGEEGIELLFAACRPGRAPDPQS